MPLREHLPSPAHALDRGNNSEAASGFTSVTYDQCKKAADDIKARGDHSRIQLVAAEIKTPDGKDIRVIDLLEAMRVHENTDKNFSHLLERASKPALNAYKRYREELLKISDTPEKSIALDAFSHLMALTESGVKQYFKTHPKLAEAFGVTVIDTAAARRSSPQTREAPKPLEKVDYPTLYRTAIEAAVKTHQGKSKTGEFPEPKDIAAESVRAEIKGSIRIPLFAVRSYLIENLKRDPDFIKKILDEVRTREV